MVEPQNAMHEQSENVVYEFDGFRVDVVRRILSRNGASIPLTSKALDTLLLLIRHRGETVTKTELMNSVWADSAVEENNLTQQISALRRALGEKPRDHRFIVTVPGHGYCFAAEVDHATANRRPRYFDPAALRGYSLAIGQVLLIAFAFLWSAVTSDATHPQSLAVLNFKVASTGDEFIGDGISETLRARLGSVEDLIVRRAPANADALGAGRTLHVDTVVTGSVQRDHDRIRVVVEMVDVSDGRIVWGKTFDESASNIFALQDVIVSDIATALNVRVSRSSG